MRRRVLGLLALYCFLAAIGWAAVSCNEAPVPSLPRAALLYPDT